MVKLTRFERAFDDLSEYYKRGINKRFIEDLKAQIEEDEDIRERVMTGRGYDRFYCVSFDRKINDPNFSYTRFDLMLVVLDALNGGTGILKPVSQLRVLKWNGTSRSLRRVIRSLIALNSDIDAFRFLVLRYPVPPEGYRIWTRTYKKL